jgi:hypothetical protein
VRVRYVIRTASKPLPSLGGSFQRARPITTVLISGPSHFAVRDAILDTGADDTVFPDGIAPILGLDLSSAESRNIHLAGRGIIPCRYLPAQLRISDYLETYEWTAVIGFVPIRLQYALLGHAGFLQFFDADFRGADLEVTLTPNRTFTGRRI